MDEEPYTVMVFNVPDLLGLCGDVVAGGPVSAEARVGICALNDIVDQVDSSTKPRCLTCKVAAFDEATPPAGVAVMVPNDCAEPRGRMCPAGICDDCCERLDWDAKAIGMRVVAAYDAMCQDPLYVTACRGHA